MTPRPRRFACVRAGSAPCPNGRLPWRASGCVAAAGLRWRIAAPMDPLSDVLRAVRLNGAFFYLVEAAAPWSVSDRRGRDSSRVMRRPSTSSRTHILTSGSCWAGLAGERQVHAAGRRVVFPQGDRISCRAPREGVDEARSVRRRIVSGHRHARPGPRARHHVRLRLPRLRRPPYNRSSRRCETDARPRDHRRLALGVPQAGRRGVAGRARGERNDADADGGADVRRGRGAATSSSSLRSGPVLAGLKDPVVGPALSQLHERPATVDAARPGARRRVVAHRLAERFSGLVGVPPMQYLTQWRLQLAAERLSSGSAKVATVGAQVATSRRPPSARVQTGDRPVPRLLEAFRVREGDRREAPRQRASFTNRRASTCAGSAARARRASRRAASRSPGRPRAASVRASPR